MIKTTSALKRVMIIPRRLSLNHRTRFHIFSATIISFTAIFFTIYTFIISSANTPLLTSNDLSPRSLPITIRPVHPLEVSKNLPIIIQQHVKLTSSYSFHKLKPSHIGYKHTDHIDILKSTTLTRRFKKRANEFLEKRCKVRFFMTWISSSSSIRVFGEREFLALNALFKSNPTSCLMILSNTMDSVSGFRILKPLTDRGFRVRAIAPDLDFLFKNTPAQSWLDNIKNGKRNPGKIPLPQNLSNLIRLAVLYKYGGVYIDTDFVVLKDFSGLRNSIGAQSATKSGNWTRLNNAVLIFEKNHPLLHKFMQEFSSNFDGNKWGYNGPYLVSRVVQREGKKELDDQVMNFRVLNPVAFYPVDWTRVGGFFRTPVNRSDRRWVEAKVSQLNGGLTYGVHLWNKESSRLKIEEGSVMDRLVRDYCVICNVK